MKKVLLVSSLLFTSINVLPMAAAMEQAAKAAGPTTAKAQHTQDIHSPTPAPEPKHTTPTIPHIGIPETPKAPHSAKMPHEADSPMHKAMKEHHATMPKMPKIAPIPPMPSAIKTHHEPGASTVYHIDPMHSTHIGVSHTQHMEDGHSKIQVAIDSMQKGVSSMNDAIDNLKDVQASIVKIKSAISELLSTHLK